MWSNFQVESEKWYILSKECNSMWRKITCHVEQFSSTWQFLLHKNYHMEQFSDWTWKILFCKQRIPTMWRKIFLCEGKIHVKQICSTWIILLHGHCPRKCDNYHVCGCRSSGRELALLVWATLQQLSLHREKLPGSWC